jgi:hypothetical protein
MWRRVLARDLFQSCGLVQKEHHANGGPSHCGGRESLRAFRRDYVFTAEQFPPD